MRLKKMLLKNIRSYEDQEIVFPEGSVLLSGEIGSGKTTLLLAIEYALFGLQPGQKGSALLRNGEDSGEVSMEFEVQGKNVLIQRRLKRNSRSIANEYAAITLDGERIEMSVTELKTKILDLLGYPSEFVKKNNLLYRYTVYTPQEEMKQIILEDSETRLNVLRHVFGIDKYKRIRDNLDLVLMQMRDESRTLQIEIRNLETDKNEVIAKEDLINLLEEKSKEKNREMLEKIKIRKAKENEIKSIEGKIKEKETFEREVEKAKIFLSSKKETLSEMSRQKRELEATIQQLSSDFNEAKYNDLLVALANKKEAIEEMHNKFIEIASSITSLEQQIVDNKIKSDRLFEMDFCPTCLQNVSVFHKHGITVETEREITEMNKKISALADEKSLIVTALEILRQDRKKLEEEKSSMEISKSKLSLLEHSKSKLAILLKNKEILEKDAALLITHLDGLKGEVLKFSVFDTKYKIKQEELRLAFKEEKNAEINYAEIRKEIELSKLFVSELKEKIASKEIMKSRLNYLLEINDWLSNHFKNLIDFTERNILLKLRREFSELFNNWFHVLAGDIFEVRLDENFTPLIMQGETEMEYSFLSGGERTSLALAYRLALNQIINSLLSKIRTRSLVILDEPTDGFSETQIDKMRDVFDQLDVEQLIIVSHDQKIEGFVDHILRLKKEDGTSIVDQVSGN